MYKESLEMIRKIGYTSEYKFDAESCGVLSAIHEQSSDINQGVERLNPEDQGLVTGDDVWLCL